MPLLWLYGHLNGRRDTLIFRGHLRQPPRPEIELASTRLWTGREALGEVDRKAWLPVTLRQAQDAGGADAGAPSTQPYVAMSNGAQGQDLLNEWFARSTRLAPGLARISVRRGAQYQLQWHSSIPDLKSVSSSEIIHLVGAADWPASEPVAA
ncbi:MAG: hypothetical protein HYR71_12275 [Chloroflexi bacterium]|nr:hypothetical protein [Chloroflexota bacterium]